MCWEIGFPTENLHLYISGQQREIMLNYPELMYYRDIVFMFKFMMTPTSSALPPIKMWTRMFRWMYSKASTILFMGMFSNFFFFGCIVNMPTENDADLTWRWRESKKEWEVVAFGQILVCTPPVDHEV